MRIGWLGAVLALALACGGGSESAPLTLATTTSVEDSGLLDYLLPRFTRESGIRVQAVAVGTGAALRMGAEGNADILLTHAPEAEQALVATGAVSGRVPIMANDFLIAGSAEDPADIAAAPSVAEALQRIRAGHHRWVSRGDRSGTHQRERALWRLAGFDPGETWDGFTSTGAGMGITLQVANERRAYLLCDLGTFLAFRDRIDLRALSPSDPALLNTYAVLRVSPEHFPGAIHAKGAQALEEFLVRADVQREIGAFGRERFGRSLFRPLHLPTAAAGNG